MQNYHTHTSYSNCFTSFKDSHMLYENYAKRAIETGGKILSCVEHGYQGNFLKCLKTANDYGLKFVFGAEAYWVEDRHAPDRTNSHIIVLAKNKKGLFQINEMLSTANEDGYYYVPRVDPELLLKLNPDDVMITTACVSFWGKVRRDEETPNGELELNDGVMVTFGRLAEHFKDSMFLEVQAHNTDWQKTVNKLCRKLKREYGVRLIAGCDSHYVYPEQINERKILREESGIRVDMDHEMDPNVFEDYPDESTLRSRFQTQGVLSADDIEEAIASTDLILKFEDITWNTDRKIPSICQHLSQEERNKMYLDKVWSAWDANKSHLMENAQRLYDWCKKNGYSEEDITAPDEQRYIDAINYETNVITSTGTADYFLLDSSMVELGQKKGGYLTPSGRGSGSSFFTNTLLGLSTIDRLALPVKLYPDRFVTAERLMSSCPDLDLNVDKQEPFAEAQEELLGKGHSYQMIAYGTQKTKAAFKMYARTTGMDAQLANEIAKQLDRYERELQFAEEDEKDDILLEDFVAEEYLPYVSASEPFRSIVVSKSPAPCGFLIYNGDIRSEIGIMKIHSKTKNKDIFVTVIDGVTAESFGYVKNDILVVKVCAINRAAMQYAGIPLMSSSDLIAETLDDPETWDILAKGYTQGVNQCQREKATLKLMQYKPRDLRDLSAFVAAIRPGFRSQLGLFLSRDRFSYDVPSFDMILHNDSSRSSWMLYQENTMTALSMAGFELSRTYPIIKAISKKKTSVIAAAKEEFLVGFAKYLLADSKITEEAAKNQAEIVWQVIEDSASYSFNASHAVCVSIDALYGAYLKAHYPYAYYQALLDDCSTSGSDGKKKASKIRQEMLIAFGIKCKPCEFRQDNRTFKFHPEDKSAVNALVTVQDVSQVVANELYNMRNNHYDTFVDLLMHMSYLPMFTKKNIDPLIYTGYFKEFGGRHKLLAIVKEFREGSNKYGKNYVDKTKEKRLNWLREFEKNAPDGDFTPQESAIIEQRYYGEPMSTDPNAAGRYMVVECMLGKTAKSDVRCEMFNMRRGTIGKVIIPRSDFNKNPVDVGTVIEMQDWMRRPIFSYEGGKRVKTSLMEVVLKKYDVISM